MKNVIIASLIVILAATNAHRFTEKYTFEQCNSSGSGETYVKSEIPLAQCVADGWRFDSGTGYLVK